MDPAGAANPTQVWTWLEVYRSHSQVIVHFFLLDIASYLSLHIQ